jgi:hypothetical protein
MPKTITNQGYSDGTSEKQEAFAKMLATIANIALLAQCNPYGYGFKEFKEFYYIDCNSGPGFTKEYGEGSPLIAQRVLSNLTCKGMKFNKVHYLFCDKNENSISQLKERIPDAHFYCGNNSDDYFYFLIKEFLPSSNNIFYSLIYSDPNGDYTDYPHSLFKQLSKDRVGRFLDMLINFNTVAIKRCRSSAKMLYNSTLYELLNEINKKNKLIRKPVGTFKHSLVLATNYEKLGCYKKINLYQFDTPKGQEYLEEGNFTRKEQKELSQGTLNFNFGDF